MVVSRNIYHYPCIYVHSSERWAFISIVPLLFQGIWGCTIDETGPVILLSPSLSFPVYTLFFSFFLFFILGIIGTDIPFEEVTCFTPGGGNEAAEQSEKDRVG